MPASCRCLGIVRLNCPSPSHVSCVCVHTGLKANTKKQKYQRILERKQATHPEQLCRGYPTEFRDFFAHCSSLGFEDRPDYRYVTSPSHGHVCSSSHRFVLLSMPHMASSGASLLPRSLRVLFCRQVSETHLQGPVRASSVRGRRRVRLGPPQEAAGTRWVAWTDLRPRLLVSRSFCSAAGWQRW